MKVVFKLNAKQLEVAMKIVASNEAAREKDNRPEEEGGASPEYLRHCSWNGDLLGWEYAHPCSNRNQELRLNPERGVVVYQGERHPLIQDGGLAVLNEIAGGDAKRLQVAEYQTSDHRLEWWQTADAVWEKMRLEELLREAERDPRVLKKRTFMAELSARAKEEKAISQPGTPEYRRLSAEISANQLSLGKRAAALLREWGL